MANLTQTALHRPPLLASGNWVLDQPRSSALQTVVPELMMEGRGLAERPRETPPTSPGGAVPSPLQSSCKVCSCPGMEMDFAVLGGLREKKKQPITYPSGAD